MKKPTNDVDLGASSGRGRSSRCDYSEGTVPDGPLLMKPYPFSIRLGDAEIASVEMDQLPSQVSQLSFRCSCPIPRIQTFLCWNFRHRLPVQFCDELSTMLISTKKVCQRKHCIGRLGKHHLNPNKIQYSYTSSISDLKTQRIRKFEHFHSKLFNDNTISEYWRDRRRLQNRMY